jgi:chemotaxis protein histidine kinase CheA
MTMLNDYFRTEAREFVNALERSLQRTPAPDPAELHRAVRGLRGTAQMAREQRVFDVVSAFESVTRAISAGALAWSDNIAARARATIDDLRVLLDSVEDDEQLDSRVSEAAARWREADPDPAPPAGAPVIDPDTSEFREFAAKEAAEIADALDQGIAALQADPMNREPLTSILRRQRALLGSARLEEIPVVADILRAVEDLTRVIVKLDVGVKQEWLDIYRVARDALQTTIAPLLRDELPQSSNSVSRLRHMRAELLERYGSTVEAPAPADDPLARTATPPEPPAAPPAAGAPVAPFMSPARSITPPTPSALPQPPTRHPSVAPLPSRTAPWQPFAPPPQTDPPGDFGADVLDLDEQSAVDEQEPEFLDLDGAAVVEEEGTLDLGEDSIVDEDAGVLDLSDEAVMAAEDEPAGDDGAGVLDLSEDAVMPADDGIVAEDGAAVLDLGEDSVIVEDGSQEVLARARELRDIIARVASHDPAARAAVDELYDLIRTALG